jgi:hypothetical protein
MTRLAIVFAALLVLAGCGSVEPLPPSALPSVEPTAELPLDPGVLGLTCGQEPRFHPSLLDVPGRAETERDAPAALLRDYVSTQGDPGLPSTGWTRVAQTADYVQFVARAPFDSGWGVVAFMVRGGRWEFALAGECHLGPAVPEGVSIAEWRLDPAFPAPAPGDRVIHTLINERACASGQPPVGRVLPAIVSYESERVVAMVLVRTIGGDCPGNPDFAFAIELSEPLGERSLFDGGVFPPRDVTKPSSG